MGEMSCGRKCKFSPCRFPVCAVEPDRGVDDLERTTAGVVVCGVLWFVATVVVIIAAAFALAA